MSRSKSNRRNWLITTTSVVAALGLLFFLPVLLPESGRVLTGKKFRIQLNLQLIEAAAKTWAIEHRTTEFAAVTKNDLIPYLPEGWVKSTAGEEYAIIPSETRAEATLRQALGDWPKGTRVFLNSTNYTIRYPNGTSAQGTANPY